jgi:predicted DNA-binding transcriptional regulator AlpA
LDATAFGFHNRGVSGSGAAASSAMQQFPSRSDKRLEDFATEGKSMPSSAKSINYIPQPSPSVRKPPVSESSARNAGWTEASFPLHAPAQPILDSRADQRSTISFPAQERLLNAREVAARLGVSERWVRDHTTRRSPKIRGVKLGTLMRYRCVDVEEFMERLTTSRTSFQRQFGG